jgi:hypothetical protein
MDARPRFSLTRRRVLAAGLGAMALATIGSRDVSARVILQRGMSGGGLAQLEGSDEPRLANFGLFASSLQLPDGTPLVLGAIQWLEAGTDLQLQSIEVTQCIPSDDRATAAEVRGRMPGSRSRSTPRLRGKGLKRSRVTIRSSMRQRETWWRGTSSGSSPTSRSERQISPQPTTAASGGDVLSVSTPRPGP